MPLTKETYVVLGENRRLQLIEARERAGLTRLQLARKLGIVRQVIWRVEEGFTDPAYDTMVRWTEALGAYGRLELFTPIKRPPYRRGKARPKPECLAQS